jgi:hypothetical protein
MSSRACWFLLAVVACKSEADTKSRDKKIIEPEGSKLAGVWADYFKCDSIASATELGTILGGPARQIDNPASVPKGVAQPCVYEVPAGTNDAGVALSVVWTFDFDCRDNYKQTADALFVEYTQRNADLVKQYDALADAGGLKPNDAGIEYHRPGESSEVAVGAKGLDHHGQAILFIDDDAPCYVRVVGPDSTRRLELAKLIAKNLTFMNAPMVPRPAK